VLASFFTADHRGAGGLMDYAHTAFRLVLVLPSRSSSPEGLDPALAQEFFVRFRNREGGWERFILVHGSKLKESVPDRYGKGSGRSVMFDEARTTPDKTVVSAH
jgi:hypothetical protein